MNTSLVLSKFRIAYNTFHIIWCSSDMLICIFSLAMPRREWLSYGVQKKHKPSRHDESSPTALEDGFLLDEDESITENWGWYFSQHCIVWRQSNSVWLVIVNNRTRLSWRWRLSSWDHCAYQGWVLHTERSDPKQFIVNTHARDLDIRFLHSDQSMAKHI